MPITPIDELERELSLLHKRNEELEREWDKLDSHPHFAMKQHEITNCIEQNNNRISELKESITFLQQHNQQKQNTNQNTNT